MPTAVVVIPTRNEERSIQDVMAEVRAGLQGTAYDHVEILITDDSIDSTRELAREAGARVVIGGGEGLGVAMFRGLKEALKFRPDVIVSVDGDGQSDAKAEIPRFVEVIWRGEADLVLGSRFRGENLIQYKYRLINRLGTRVLTRMLNYATGLRLTDSHGGIRAMRAAVVEDLQMIGTHTYVQETIIDAYEKGYRIIELPSVWRVRQHGKSRVVGSIVKYIFYTLPVILLRSGHHVRSLYSAGLVLVGLAVLYFFYIVASEGFTWAMGNRTPAFLLVALMVSTGIQFFFFGFILQLLNQIKRSIDRSLHHEAERTEPVPDVTAKRAVREISRVG